MSILLIQKVVYHLEWIHCIYLKVSLLISCNFQLSIPYKVKSADSMKMKTSSACTLLSFRKLWNINRLCITFSMKKYDKILSHNSIYLQEYCKSSLNQIITFEHIPFPMHYNLMMAHMNVVQDINQTHPSRNPFPLLHPLSYQYNFAQNFHL